MVAFLEAIVDAIWQLHGHGMVRWLQRHQNPADVSATVHPRSPYHTRTSSSRHLRYPCARSPAALGS